MISLPAICKVTAKQAMLLCMASMALFAATPAHAGEPPAAATDASTAAKTDELRVVGASTVVLPVTDAAAILKKEQIMTLQISSVINSSLEKIRALGEGQAEVAMFARPLMAADTAPYPDIDFKQIQFGEEAAALVVSQDVWDAGVHSLTRVQVRQIYEQKVQNWKQLDGPDKPIVLYTPEPARGVWACFVQWIYDDPTLMRENHFAMTYSDDDARADIEATAGSIAPVSMLYAANNNLHSIAVKDQNGKLIEPTAANIANHSYPLVRPLLMVMKGRPLGTIKIFVKFMTGDRGQDLVHKYNYLTLKELGIAPPSL